MKAIEKKLFESGDLNKFDVPLLCTLLLAMTLPEPLPQAIHDIREVRNSASHSDTYCLKAEVLKRERRANPESPNRGIVLLQI
jgi:hypothetical protein